VEPPLVFWKKPKGFKGLVVRAGEKDQFIVTLSLLKSALRVEPLAKDLHQWGA
jgi:hypothetical protein